MGRRFSQINADKYKKISSKLTEKDLLPMSAVVATRNRSRPLARMLHSLAHQSAQPVQLIVVDGSTNDETYHLCRHSLPGLAAEISYHRAIEVGAATQRNQAVAYASQDVIWFLDDDILFEEACVARLWTALQSDPDLGGVNAMITNQRYHPPGPVSRVLFPILHGRVETSYAGKCIGPALNLLPEDDPALPDIVPVEWLNTTCTLYRRQALPHPPFSANFVGYSLMEDVALSLRVGRKWKLANARTARIFHDSQPGDHKSNPLILARMEMVNRYYVMTHILERRSVSDYFKFALIELFGVVAFFVSTRQWRQTPGILLGKWRAFQEIRKGVAA